MEENNTNSNNENINMNSSPQEPVPANGSSGSDPVQPMPVAVENGYTQNSPPNQDFVYKHTFYEDSVPDTTAAFRQAPGTPYAEPGQPNSGIPPEKNEKRKETTFRKGKLAISFICVILATSLITSAASYSIFNYYGSRDPSGSSSLSSSSQSSQAASSNPSGNSSTSQVSSGTGNVLSITEINNKVSPSVVLIQIQAVSSNVFGQQESTSGSGSGIIISEDGYILTNNHVIDGANKITVELVSGKTYSGTIIGKDPQTDLAVIKIDGTGLSYATLGDSSIVEVGDLAIAIGNPLGAEGGTLTVGVISALNREVTIENVTMNLFQTDAAVNPGNSGGALVNEYGEVIGIVNAKTSAVGIEGLGYAIPINDAKTVIEDLMNKGYVSGRLKIGIATKDITEELAAYYNLPIGIYVSAVEEGSPAEKAGILVEDIIIGVDGSDVLTTAELGAIRDSHKIGDSIKILLSRNGKEVVVTLVLEEDTSTGR
jgi:serine protease Do